MTTLRVPIVRVRPAEDADVPLPVYMTDGAAGMDLRAAVQAPVVLLPGERALIPTGIAIALPEGFEAQVRPRSGLALRHGVTCLNAPGTIDSDYRGEVQAVLANLGREPFDVRRGDRVAQLVISPVARASWQEVTSLPDTPRSARGFGHTGNT